MAKAVMVAEKFRHSFVGTEHLLLAILSEEDGTVPKLIDAAGLNLQKVHANVEAAAITHLDFGPEPEKPNLTEVAKRLRELADLIA